MDGIINLIKAPGMTSSDAVVCARRILGERRIGHAGTLDRAAAGVLPLLVGKATRLFDEVTRKRKTYVAEFTFGIETDTLDGEGSVVAHGEQVGADALLAVLPGFLGDIAQRPPIYSAVKHEGARASDHARAGRVPELAERRVTIHALRLLRQTTPGAYLFEIACSKGTYIRSLCRDIARAVHTCGYVSYLVRTQVGPYLLEDAITVDELETVWRGSPAAILRPMDEPLAHLPSLRLDAARERAILNGRDVDVESDGEGRVRLYGADGLFIGVGALKRGRNRMTVRIKINLEHTHR